MRRRLLVLVADELEELAERPPGVGGDPVTLRVAQPARVLDLPRLRGHRHVLEAEIRGEVLEVAHVGRVDWAAAGAARSQPRSMRPRSSSTRACGIVELLPSLTALSVPSWEVSIAFVYRYSLIQGDHDA